MSSFIDFAALKERMTVEEAIPLLGLSLKPTNGQWRGPCPVCKSGGDRALVVTPDKNAFYCFGARSGGDVIAFAAHIRDCNVKDAAAFLDGNPEDGEGDESPGSASDSDAGSNTVPKERKKGDIRSLQPLAYLEPDHESVLALGLNEQTCAQFGAGYAPKGIMRSRLAIPIHDPDGTLIAYCGRATKEETPTLIFPRDFDPLLHVFNFHNIGEGELALLRDPLEVLQAAQNGIENTVSFLTQDVCPEQLQLLAKLMAKAGCENMRFA
ncbi:MAG: hypothetical protein GY761_09810 [Hyphomicrobiales bacterium]|nr:hypothetical protein [Hyphomicrobiales bacterium]